LPVDTAVGLLFFPNKDSVGSPEPTDVSSCVAVDQLLPIALLGPASSAQRTSLRDALNGAQPIGYTPTHDAFHYALSSSLEASALAGVRYALIYTDGAPTLALGCVGTSDVASPAPTQPIIDEIQRAHDRGLRTFLIGAPGTERSAGGQDARKWMSQAARAGGTATSGCSDDGPNFCHIDLSQSSDFKTALVAGLSNVSGQIIPCTYALPEAPAQETLDLTNINVFHAAAGGDATEIIPRDQQPSCSEGWQLADSQVVLCPSTCDRIRNTAGSSIKILFGCASVVVPR
jgi:hypothetical protein